MWAKYTLAGLTAVNTAAFVPALLHKKEYAFVPLAPPEQAEAKDRRLVPKGIPSIKSGPACVT